MVVLSYYAVVYAMCGLRLDAVGFHDYSLWLRLTIGIVVLCYDALVYLGYVRSRTRLFALGVLKVW